MEVTDPFSECLSDEKAGYRHQETGLGSDQSLLDPRGQGLGIARAVQADGPKSLDHSGDRTQKPQ